MSANLPSQTAEQDVRIAFDALALEGSLAVPLGAAGIVVFAHGSGSSRHNPRNRLVATRFQQAGLGTLLLDLLTVDEEAVDAATSHLRFDIDLLARRLVEITDWLAAQLRLAILAVGYFGASTGAAAALVAAVERPARVSDVVSRGGRPDLAQGVLALVQAPTLLVVGSRDPEVLELNRGALAHMGRAHVQLAIVEGASHLFEEPGALDEVARLAAA